MSRDFDSTNVLTTLDVRQTGAMEQVLLFGFYDRVSDQLLKISLIARILLSLAGTRMVAAALSSSATRTPRWHG
jgi:hypothetical protein